MSVVGFDVGNDSSCVAIARKRGIDVLLNQESKRETPAMVSFGDKMRFTGTHAYSKVGMNPKNTPHQLKRLLGKQFQDPAVQADISKLPFKVTEGPNGGCLVHVTFCNEPATFTPEQLMAMVLVDQKKIAEAETGIAVTDCAISVPTFYTDQERYAMLNAASIAGLNCLRLVNETTATALAYGIFKTDLPDSEPIHVAFIDVGHAHTQVRLLLLMAGSAACHLQAQTAAAAEHKVEALLCKISRHCNMFAVPASCQKHRLMGFLGLVEKWPVKAIGTHILWQCWSPVSLNLCAAKTC
jgi:heat shock protein 4